MEKKITGFQCVYYFFTGLWPLVSIKTFEAATGPKTDTWLVQMVGLLTASAAAGLTLAMFRNSFDKALLLIVICCAVSFLYIDVVYWRRGVISSVYLADAALQLVFVVVQLRRLIR
jgi:hypothetical protein